MTAPFPSASGRANDLGGAECIGAVQASCAHLDIDGLAIGVPCSEARAKGFEVKQKVCLTESTVPK